MDYRIYPPEEMMMAEIALPLSKSISNRMLIINALTPGGDVAVNIADCDDTNLLAKALSATAAAKGEVEVNTGAAGTATRFITAYLSAYQGIAATVDGSERMRQRPMGILIDSLRALGADIECTEREGYLPLRINGRRLSGGKLNIDATFAVHIRADDDSADDGARVDPASGGRVVVKAIYRHDRRADASERRRGGI